MTADGRRRVSVPGVFESPKAQAPGSKRISRGFFSLFSFSKGQPQPLAPVQSPQAMSGKAQRTRPSIPSTESLQALPGRFDAISLVSPSQRDDPAFSRDPTAHLSLPRDAIRTRSAAEPGPRLIGPPDLGPVASQQKRLAELQQKSRENLASYSSSSQASESSLTLPSTSSGSVSGHSQGHSIKSPSSSSSLSRDESLLVTPTRIFPSREDSEDSLPMVASSVMEKNQPADLKDRPWSPPPEYELMASPQEMRAFEIPAAPRPELSRIDSAPELHHIEPPALPHRSATAPNLGLAPSSSGSRRATNTRKPQAYDLDKIDELDESNPLGVALHHEGPFQAIASVLKGPQSQPSPPQIRAPRAPKPPRQGGSLNISPGQVLPSNFSYLYHQQPQPHPQDYGSSPQASTSYISPQSQFGRPLQSQFGQFPPSQFGQSPYGQSNMNTRGASHTQEPPWSQTHPHHPPPSQHTADPLLPTRPPHSHPPYNPETTYIQTQYDPVDPPAQSQNPVHTGNPYYPEPHLLPPGLGHRASYSSEDNSDAYGGIEVEDPPPKRERFSAPPHPTASQMDPQYAPPQHGDPNSGFEPRRHTFQAGYAPDPRAFPDAARFNVGQNSSNIRHSPNPNGPQPVGGAIDPRMFQNHSQLNAGQNLSGIRHSPNPNGQPIVAHQHAFLPPQTASSALGPGPNEQDRRRPSSYQPQPTVYANHGSMQRPMEQHTPPMAEHDPRRRASYQPVPAPRAPPADPARSELERNQYRQQELAALAQDRPQSVTAPSVATTTNPHRRLPPHTPRHLVMPTPLQQSSPLPTNNPSGSYPNGHYESPNSSQTRLPLQQAQPTRAQTIQMDGNRHLLKKKMSVVKAPAPAPPPPLIMPPKAPPPARRYMEPPPTVPEPSAVRPAQQKEKRSKRLLSKRRSDL